ncbi:MAG: hypothetical protein AVDCRST_MAG30-1480, partial [uncultured Solirubrobacteraceae bacterium]
MPALEPTTGGESSRLTGEALLEAISSELLVLYGNHYGPTATRAKTYLNDNILVCVLQEDLLGPAEIDAVRSGSDEHVL